MVPVSYNILVTVPLQFDILYPGDSLSYHDEMAFSTEDNDNDLHRRNCAVENKGGWWFNSCYSSNLNGVYHTGWYSQVGTMGGGQVKFSFTKITMLNKNMCS